jgi:hypothetical protein
MLEDVTSIIADYNAVLERVRNMVHQVKQVVRTKTTVIISADFLLYLRNIYLEGFGADATCGWEVEVR